MAVAGCQGALQRAGAARPQRGTAARDRARTRRSRRHLGRGISSSQGRSHRRGLDRRHAGLAASRYRYRAEARGHACARGPLLSGWLLDTNILSELRRRKPERKVLAFVTAQPLDLLYVSTVSFAEIRFGIELVSEAARHAELNDWLAHKVRPMFEQRVLAISEDIMFKWRLLVEDGRKARHTFSQPDLIIAATALDHGLTVVSRDVGDYRKARVPVLTRISHRFKRIGAPNQRK